MLKVAKKHWIHHINEKGKKNNVVGYTFVLIDAQEVKNGIDISI